MSIIQDIRDKYAKVAVVAIALALIGFILTDYFSGRGRGGARGGGSKSIGAVNGTSINFTNFAKKVERLEANMRSQQGMPAAAVTQQAVEGVWEQEVNKILLDDEADKLGLKVGNKEWGDVLYGPNAPADLKQQLTDENGYDPVRAKQRVDMMLKDKTVSQEQKDNFNNYSDQLKQQRLSEKYVTLLTNSINYPRWFLEKQNADNSQLGKISIVREAYTSIPDSTIKIEDKEIADYLSKHKEDYKQEESRSIAFVTFNASPTAADSLVIKEQLLALKPEMDTTADIALFLSSHGANYSNLYQTGNQLGVIKDTIKRLTKNQVFGPYVEGNRYMLVKLLDTKSLPDSVKVRHILISTTQRDQSGQTTQVRDTVTAFNLADSIRKEIAKGANFDSLVVKLSDDQGSKDKGGVYDNVYYGQMVPEFNDFIFMNAPGTKGIVKTDFGYHYIEILSSKGSNVAYRIAQLPLEILASKETIDNASNEANQFAADSRDQVAFDSNFEKTQKPKGRTKGISPNIRPNDAQVQGVGYSRPLIRSIYKASLGEVVKPEDVGDDYIVAVVTNIFKEGTKSVAVARPEIESALRNEKKAEMLKQKIGKVTTLEAAAVALGGKPIEVIDSVRLNGAGKLGYEPMVSGATFNPANKGKIVPEALEGVNGVYVVRVENVSATPSTSGEISEQRKNLYTQTKQFIGNPQAPTHPIGILRKTATIKDKRSERY